MRSLVFILVLSAMLMALGACERPIPLSNSNDEGYYTQRNSDSEAGTGRFYMGREIAEPLGSDAAEWLERAEREYAEMPRRVIQGLRLGPSDVVADVGAGTGYFTFRISNKVPRGLVYAVEVREQLVDHLQERKQRKDAGNVRIVEAAATDANLPPGRIDVALLVGSYHELTHPREMGLSLQEALRPGGQLVIVEYREEDATIPVDDVHRMSEEQVRTELEEIGFRWRETRDFLPQQHFIVFEKPFETGDFDFQP